MAVLASALSVIAFIPNVAQEVVAAAFLTLGGGVIAALATLRGITAFGARRTSHESPAMAAAAIALSILPLVLGLLILPSVGCYLSEACYG
jgi:hypothetical protein